MEQVVTELLCILAGGSDLASGIDTGVVDQDVQTFLLTLQFLGQAEDVFLVGDVSYEGDNLARDAFAVGLNNLFELLFGAADNVNLGTINRKCLHCLISVQ